MADRLLTVTELATLWGRSRRTVLRLIKSGELAPVNTSTGGGRRTWGIPESEIERFALRRRAITKPKQPSRARRISGEKRWY